MLLSSCSINYILAQYFKCRLNYSDDNLCRKNTFKKRYWGQMDIIELDRYKSRSSLDFEEPLIYRPALGRWLEKQHIFSRFFVWYILTMDQNKLPSY